MADVVVKFVSDAGDLLRDLSDVDSAASGLGSTMAGAANVAGGLGAALLAAGTAAFTMTQQVVDARNALSDMSARTGIATDTLNALQLASRRSGADLSELEGVLRKVTAEGLDFDQVVASLQAIEDPTDRAAAAMEMLGEEGGRLVQVLGDGNFAAFQEFARTFGTDTGPEAAKQAAEFQQRLGELQTVIEGLVDDAFGPLIEQTTVWLESFTRGLIFVGEIGKGVFSALSTVVTGFTDILDTAASNLMALLRGDFDALTIAEPLTAAFDEVQSAVDTAFAKVADYNRLLLEMGEAGEVAADGLGKTADGIDAVDETIVVTAGDSEDAEKATNDWFAALNKVAELGNTLAGAFETFGKKSAETGELTEKAMRQAFNASKAAGIADAVIKTAQGIATGLTLGPIAGPIYSAAAAATGAIQIATIAAQQFEGGGGGAPSAGGFTQGAIQGAAAATQGGVTKNQGPNTNTMFRGAATAGGQMYRHRDLDVVARDGRVYPGGAFDFGGSTGQRRYERG